VEEARRHYENGMALIQQGRLDGAVEQFERARRLLPDHLLVLNALGAALTHKGEFARAERHLSRAVEIDPSFTPARKNLAAGLFQQGRYEDSTPHFEVLERVPAERPLANLFLGMIAAEQARYPEAAERLAQARGLLDRHPRARLLFCRALHKSGRTNELAKTLAGLEGAPGLGTKDQIEAAVLASRAGRYAQALGHLDQAAQAKPKPPGLDYQRAVLLSRMGRAAEALRLLEGSPATGGDPRALNLLGRVAEQEGRLELAVESLRRAIELEPGVEVHYLDLSLLCLKHGNEELGEEIVDVGLRNIPGSYRLLLQKGAILERQSRRDEAKEVFRNAISLEDDHRLALAGLAATQIFGGETAQALESLREGLERFPEDFYLHYLYGYALEESLGATVDRDAAASEARKAFQRAIELNPEYAESFYRLGKLLAEDDPNRAAANLERALQLDPSHQAAKYQLGRLYMKTGKRQPGLRLMQEVREAKANQLEEERKPGLGVVRASRPPQL